ncbi:hypothetical protein K439DRAFT_1649550 [Ramaria rubella]|nr:hypothetical protein K439DRAFT_1649550 [Ramaria rubella]
MSDALSRDAPSPQIIKRVKSRASRVRDASPPSPDAPSADDSPAAHTLATKLKNKAKRSKSRLSFGTDEQSSDGEVFKVKKSNLSRRLVLGAAPTTPGVASLPPNLEQASISPRYTQAHLNELKASTPSTPATRPPIPAHDVDASFDIEGAVVENAADLLGTGLDDPSTSIPSASAISAAKEKRTRLRATDIAPDEFISLSVTKQSDVPQGPHPESRLVREEDELGEGEDDMAEYTGAQERIALGKKARQNEERMRRMGMVELIDDAEEEDEETMEWERAQVRRAAVEDRGRDLTQPKAVYTPAPIPTPTALPTLSTAVPNLTSALTALTHSHTTHTTTLTTLASEQTALEEKRAALRGMVEEAERKRAWFGAFREWVESVAAFLDEKFPLLEALEEEHVSLLQERFEMIATRRRQDDEDDIALFLGRPPRESEPPDPERHPSENTSTLPARRSARSGRRLLRRARTQGQAHVPLKEPPNPNPNVGVAAADSDSGYSTDATLPPSAAQALHTALHTLHTRTLALLADVHAPDFRDPRRGLAVWFGAWREGWGESYRGAWGGLGCVGAWEWWGRVEMVGWDFVEDETRGLDSFEWAHALHEYSRPRLGGTAKVKSKATSKTGSQNGMDVDTAPTDADLNPDPDPDPDPDDPNDNDAEPPLGPDGDLVSSMISQTVIPRLCVLIARGAFDPYSARHVRRVIDVAEQVEASVGKEGRFETLLKATTAVFQTAVSETQALLTAPLPSISSPSRTPPHPARRRFLTRRIKLLANILKWRKYSGERFGIGEAARALVGDVMVRVAVGGGEGVLRKAVEMMPKELVPVEATRALC